MLAPPVPVPVPVPVARVAADAWAPAVAVNAAGMSLVAWDDGGRVFLRRSDFAAAQAFDRQIGEPLVAVGADGTAAALWTAFGAHGRTTIEATVAPPGAAFGAPVTLDARAPRLEEWQLVAAGGRFVAFWSRGSKRLSLRYAIGVRSFGRARVLAAANRFSELSAAARGGGRVVAAWTGLHRAQTATLAAGASRFGAIHDMSAKVFSPPQVFANAIGYQRWTLDGLQMRDSRGLTAGRLQLDRASTVDGPWLVGPVATWEWTRERGDEGPVVAGEVEAAVRDASGRYGKPIRLTAAGEHPDGDFTLAAAATPTTTVIAWPTSTGALRYATGPAFTAPITLATGVRGGVNLAAAGNHVVIGWAAHGTIWTAQVG